MFATERGAILLAPLFYYADGGASSWRAVICHRLSATLPESVHRPADFGLTSEETWGRLRRGSPE
jgi:hypothetical protein